MIRIVCIIPLLVMLMACSSTKETYAQCILENMPGTSNTQTRILIHSQCQEKYPDMYYKLEKGYARSFFNTMTEEECMIKHGKNTLERYAVFNIRQACSCLYGEPVVDNQQCEYPKNVFDPSTARRIS